MQFLAQLNESSGRAIIFTLALSSESAAVSAPELDVLAQFVLKDPYLFNPWIPLILAH